MLNSTNEVQQKLYPQEQHFEFRRNQANTSRAFCVVRLVSCKSQAKLSAKQLSGALPKTDPTRSTDAGMPHAEISSNVISGISLQNRMQVPASTDEPHSNTLATAVRPLDESAFEGRGRSSDQSSRGIPEGFTAHTGAPKDQSVVTPQHTGASNIGAPVAQDNMRKGITEEPQQTQKAAYYY